MNKNIIIFLVTAVLILGLGIGAYILFFQKQPSPPAGNTSNQAAEPDINAIGTHQLTEAQKKNLGIDPSQAATLQVVSANTNDNAVIRILNVEPLKDAPVDTDGDGLADIDEMNLYKTDPKNADTDEDGVTDGEEVRVGFDPLKKDTLGTGKGDYWELTNNREAVIDSDRDGLTDLEEKKLGTDPKNPDTDDDGYPDGMEVKNGHDPLKK